MMFESARTNRHSTINAMRLACAIEETVASHLSTGKLVRVLEEWCPPFPGFHLYFSARRQMAASLRALIDFIRISAHGFAFQFLVNLNA